MRNENISNHVLNIWGCAVVNENHIHVLPVTRMICTPTIYVAIHVDKQKNHLYDKL